MIEIADTTREILQILHSTGTPMTSREIFDKSQLFRDMEQLGKCLYAIRTRNFIIVSKNIDGLNAAVLSNKGKEALEQDAKVAKAPQEGVSSTKRESKTSKDKARDKIQLTGYHIDNDYVLVLETSAGTIEIDSPGNLITYLSLFSCHDWDA